MTTDFYSETKILAADLDQFGLESWATVLEDTIAAGATSGEILMGLRWHLQKLLAEESHLPGDLRARAQKLADAMDAAL